MVDVTQTPFHTDSCNLLIAQTTARHSLLTIVYLGSALDNLLLMYATGSTPSACFCSIVLHQDRSQKHQSEV